jgi:hypothetical protein
MPANNVLDYVNYFRQIAVQHKDIRHNTTSEDGDAPIGSKKFMRTSVSEVLSSLPRDAGFPLMCLELYDNNLKSPNQVAIIGNYRGAFMVLEQVGNGKFSEQEQAYAKCESIVHEVLQKIWADHYGPSKTRCTTPFEEVDFNNIEIIFVSGVFNGTEYGVRCEFSFNFHQTNQIARVPTEGTFITE